eukprot:scaffold1195_cov358-Prasinococcus_capsulatus_cf.AAC.9
MPPQPIPTGCASWPLPAVPACRRSKESTLAPWLSCSSSSQLAVASTAVSFVVSAPTSSSPRVAWLSVSGRFSVTATPSIASFDRDHWGETGRRYRELATGCCTPPCTPETRLASCAQIQGSHTHARQQRPPKLGLCTAGPRAARHRTTSGRSPSARRGPKYPPCGNGRPATPRQPAAWSNARALER